MNRKRFRPVPLLLLWILGLSGALVSVGLGLFVPPTRYDAARSARTNPMEASIEEEQNHLVADALNSGQIRYHPNMASLVQPRSAAWLYMVDLVRMLLASALPIILIGGLIRKTRARRM